MIEVIADLAEKDDEVLVDQFYRIIDQFKSQELTRLDQTICAQYILFTAKEKMVTSILSI